MQQQYSFKNQDGRGLYDLTVVCSGMHCVIITRNLCGQTRFNLFQLPEQKVVLKGVWVIVIHPLSLRHWQMVQVPIIGIFGNQPNCIRRNLLCQGLPNGVGKIGFA